MLCRRRPARDGGSRRRSGSRGAMTPSTRPSAASSAAGTVVTASCSSGSKSAPSASMRFTPKPSSLARNCCWTISTPCRSGSGFAGWLVPSLVEGPLRGVDRAIEVVDHLEQADQHVAAAALGVLRQLLAHARAGVLEFLRRLAVLRQVLLRLLLGARRPGARAPRRRSASARPARLTRIVAARPPAAVHHLHGVVLLVSHRIWKFGNLRDL